MDDRLPLTVVTGFLGSGKTTLVRRFLASADGAGTGIVVNELGEIGLDHHLLVHASEHVELLDKGCLCCARRADIGRALHNLVRDSRVPGSKGFRRAIIETSGLADPAPIVTTLARDPWLKAHVRLAGVVAVVDAVAGPRNLDHEDEARRQVAIADTVVVTKRDLRAAAPMEAIVRAVRRIATDLRVLDAQEPAFDVAGVLGGAGHPIGRDAPDLDPPDVAPTSHAGGVSSFILPVAEIIDWPAFTVWLSALLYAHGDRILRVKGLLRTSSSRDPLVIHGVQHVMHPPVHLAGGSGSQKPFLVFVVKGIERQQIAESLERYVARHRHAHGTAA
jgi:G3E family GTPase